jgi:hypothetical protein
MVSAREVAADIIRIRVGIVLLIFAVDIVEDEQPIGITWLVQPAYHVPHHGVAVPAA